MTDSGGPRPRALGLVHATDAMPGVRLGDGGAQDERAGSRKETSEGLSLRLV
jgi:hypothetical protein